MSIPGIKIQSLYKKEFAVDFMLQPKKTTKYSNKMKF